MHKVKKRLGTCKDTKTMSSGFSRHTAPSYLKTERFQTPKE
ncbi:unnamed protein product [Brassica oleracea]